MKFVKAISLTCLTVSFCESQTEPCDGICGGEGILANSDLWVSVPGPGGMSELNMTCDLVDSGIISTEKAGTPGCAAAQAVATAAGCICEANATAVPSSSVGGVVSGAPTTAPLATASGTLSPTSSSSNVTETVAPTSSSSNATETVAPTSSLTNAFVETTLPTIPVTSTAAPTTSSTSTGTTSSTGGCPGICSVGTLENPMDYVQFQFGPETLNISCDEADSFIIDQVVDSLECAAASIELQKAGCVCGNACPGVCGGNGTLINGDLGVTIPAFNLTVGNVTCDLVDFAMVTSLSDGPFCLALSAFAQVAGCECEAGTAATSAPSGSNLVAPPVAPTSAPVSAPIAAPVSSPTSSPVSSPVASPTSPGASSPTSPSVSSPTSPGSAGTESPSTETASAGILSTRVGFMTTLLVGMWMAV